MINLQGCLRAMALAFAALSQVARGQTPEQVLVVVNRQSLASREIGEYYMHRRLIPLANLCNIDTADKEEIRRDVYDTRIERPIAAFLRKHGFEEKILYIVLTNGVPLKIGGNESLKLSDPGASVDSELTLLYARMKGASIPLPGAASNPFYGKSNAPFAHPTFAMYLVTRLAGYDMRDMKAIVDRALAARNRGKFVIDTRDDEDTPGNHWLRTAAALLPKDRVVLDDSGKVLTGIREVIAYASWGSNDHARKRRFLHFEWLPGAIATEFVSTNARTFERPPDNWELGTWGDRKSWFADAPQTLTADYIHEGATGASGQVYEPYLHLTPHPEFILPAYAAGRTLAESFYLGIPGLSWMNIVVGDPLCRLRP